MTSTQESLSRSLDFIASADSPDQSDSVQTHRISTDRISTNLISTNLLQNHQEPIDLDSLELSEAEATIQDNLDQNEAGDTNNTLENEFNANQTDTETAASLDHSSIEAAVSVDDSSIEAANLSAEIEANPGETNSAELIEANPMTLDSNSSPAPISSNENDSARASFADNEPDFADNKLDVLAEQQKSPAADPETNGFSNFGFCPEILSAIGAMGYREPSPIQKAAIPELMLGRDVLGQAQTGTGKTAAFGLPLLAAIDQELRHPQVLVLAPTRELAMQVAEAFNSYAANMPRVRVLAIYGGADFRDQIHHLRRGVQIVVGTPGRVMDHMRQGTLDLSNLRTLVLDEADEMLRMGFIDDVEWVLNQLPEQRQVVLFSATMPNEIRRISQKYLSSPAEVTIRAVKA